MSKRWDALIAKEVNGKNYWTKIGAMFENRSGNGFSLVLDAIPPTVDGAYRISLFEPKDNNDRGSNNGGGNSNSGGSSYSSNSGNSNNSSYSSGRPGANRGGQSDNMEDDIPF